MFAAAVVLMLLQPAIRIALSLLLAAQLIIDEGLLCLPLRVHPECSTLFVTGPARLHTIETERTARLRRSVTRYCEGEGYWRAAIPVQHTNNDTGNCSFVRNQAVAGALHDHDVGPNVWLTGGMVKGMPIASFVVCQTVLPHQLKMMPPLGRTRQTNTRSEPNARPASRAAART